MAYLAPIHRPTSIRHALKLNLVSPEEECLIVAKADRLEVYNQSQDGLVLFHTSSLYGKIIMLERLRPPPSQTDLLFIGTDRYMYFTVAWDAETRQLKTEQSYSDQADKTSRDSQTDDQCLIDPSGRFMALLLFDGIVTIVPTVQGSKKRTTTNVGLLGDPIPTRISDLFVRSAAFLYPQPGDDDQPKIAFLYEDSLQRACMSLRKLNYAAGGSGEPGNADLEHVIGIREDLELGASHIIPVPAPACKSSKLTIKVF